MKRGKAMSEEKGGRENEAVKTTSKKKKGGSSSHRVLSQCNWGDNPSGEVLHLVKLALRSFNQFAQQLAQKRPNIFPWVEVTFGGALVVNSFVDDGVWCHINFRTKVLVMDATKSTMGNDGPCLLFAELKRSHGKTDYEVISCHFMGCTGYSTVPRLLGCKACDVAPFKELMVHPSSYFNVGPSLTRVPEIYLF